MSYLRSAFERAAYAQVVYGDSGVYVNKLDIRDAGILENAERALTERRARQGFPPEANHAGYEGFKAIHRHLFQDLYDWAGQERRYTTGRNTVPFAVPEHIGAWMEQQFTKLETDDFLVARDADSFATTAAMYVNEINAAHPFIDGNGRCLRFWLRMLCNNAGFDLTLVKPDKTRWNESSRKGFLESDNRTMAALIRDRLVDFDRNLR